MVIAKSNYAENGEPEVRAQPLAWPGRGFDWE